MSLCGDAVLKYLMTCFYMPVFAKRKRGHGLTKILFVIVPLNMQFWKQQLWKTIFFIDY